MFPCTTDDKTSMINHLVERNGNRCFVPLNDVRERIADQEHIGSSLIEQASECVVVRGDHGEAFGARFHFADSARGDAAGFARQAVLTNFVKFRKRRTGFARGFFAYGIGFHSVLMNTGSSEISTGPLFSEFNPSFALLPINVIL